MSIIIDRDVEEAALLLQGRFEASRLVSIARSLASVAPLLWERHGHEQVVPAALDYATTSAPNTPARPIQ